MQVESYDIMLDVDLKNLRFDGRVQIKLDSENDVTLNSLDLKILQVKANNNPVIFKQRGEDLVTKTGPFNGILGINFSGSIFADRLMGLYKASYADGYIASTQFEPVAARKMIPCIDHPAYKAEFKLTVKIEKDLQAISNTPIASEKMDGSKKIVEFQRTPRMSTYLLYLGVGKFEEIREKSGKIEHIVATVPGKIKSGKFAMDVGKQSVKYFESYFELPYVLPKLHLIAVPEFAVGAMENWGAITFREVRLLVDQGSSVHMKKWAGEVIAHEIAHMWFGDLVTMKWWDDLWLNESFATFMAFKAVNHMFPDWNAWEDFVRIETSGTMSRDSSGAMNRDSLLTTHAIEVPVNSPAEIEEIFDEISYGKGASVIRMVEAFAGEDNFMKGVRSYLQKYKFGNAVGNDLWTQVEEASKTQVKKVVNDWISKPGYPVLHLSLDGNKLIIRQERFLLNGKHEPSIWPVPVTMELNGAKRKLLVEKETEQVDVPSSLQSLRVNVDQTGFYRVDYGSLLSYAWKSKTSAMDRYGVINDAFAFTVQGSMKVRDYLGLIERYTREEEYLPAYEASDQLAILYSISPSIREASKRFHRSQLKILEKKSDENSRALHGQVARRLVLVDPEYAEQLSSRFDQYDAAEPDMKEATAVAYARTNGDFDTIYRNYKTRTSEEDKVRFLSAMTSFVQPALVTRGLNLALSGEVKKQDVRTLFGSLRFNPEARPPNWNWVAANFDWLQRIHEGSGVFSRLLMVSIPFVGIGRVAEVERFFSLHKPADLAKGIETGLERLLIYDKLVGRMEKAEKLVEA